MSRKLIENEFHLPLLFTIFTKKSTGQHALYFIINNYMYSSNDFKMKNKKYHTVGTVLKIPHHRNSSKNTTLSEQF
jgi:hypothetical protein